MKTTTVLRMASLAALLTASAWLASCSGDDGAVGPDGKDGTNGTNGTDGSNGVGYNEAIAKGNVLLILDGTRPDGVAFKDTIDFRFAPSATGYSMYVNGTVFDGVNPTSQFGFKRYQGWDGSGDGYYEESNETGTLESNGGTAVDGSGNILARYLNISTSSAIVEFPAEKKYFELELNATYNIFPDENGQLVSYGENFTDSTLTSFTKIIGTDGALNYNVTFTAPAEGNSTGHDLKITAIANVKLFQRIEEADGNIEGRFARSASPNGRATAGNTRKVAKAIMKPIE